MTETRQLSNGGGFAPVWRKDGKALFFMTPLGAVISADLTLGAQQPRAIPRELFRVDARHINMPQFAAVNGGRRFLVLEALPSVASDERLVVMTNWLAAIRP
jgi:hypothetical protein